MMRERSFHSHHTAQNENTHTYNLLMFEQKVEGTEVWLRDNQKRNETKHDRFLPFELQKEFPNFSKKKAHLAAKSEK
jgi:hypothetical protein